MAFIGGLSVLVMVHELGHFAVAKAVGIRVENFSIFMGQPVLAVRRAAHASDPARRWQIRVFRWTWGLSDEQFLHGETEYALRLLPFGGYVKMAGQSDVGEADHKGEDWEFTAKPLWARAAVVAAGPAMNIVLAIVFFAALNMTYGVIGRIGIGPAPSMFVSSVSPGTPASEIGVVPGSQWIILNGEPVTTWERVGEIAEKQESATLSLLTPSGDTLIARLPSGLESLYDFGVTWEPPAAVGTIIPLEPAAESGMRVGDVILSVDGVPVSNWSEMSQAIRARPGEKIPFEIERDGQRMTLPLRPGIEIATEGFDDGVTLGIIGSVTTAFSQTWSVATKIFEFIKRLVTRTISPKYIAGPVGIFQITGAAAAQGWATYLVLIAVLSANLAVINLLPLAVLDGGHLLFFAYEGVTGKRPSTKQQGIMQQIGVVVLISLLVLVTINDIGRLF